MTVRKVWLGSTGPFLYDDSILYIDEDGVISPDNQQAIATDGQIVIQSAPSSPVHAVRKQDLDDAVGDISGLEARVSAIEALNATQQSSIDYLLGHMISAESNITYLQSHLATAESNITALQAGPQLTIISLTYYGWAPGPTVRNGYYTKHGDVVVLNVPGMTGTSSTAEVWLGGFPPELRTWQYAFALPIFVFNGSAWVTGIIQPRSPYDPSWPIEILPSVGGSWVPSGGKTVASSVIVFHSD